MIVHRNIWNWGRSDTIILAEGRAFCHVSIENDVPGAAWLSGVSVYEPSRGKGLGNHLLQAAEENARERGAKTICLWANLNDWPIEWYKRKGYVFSRLNVEGGHMALLKKSLP